MISEVFSDQIDSVILWSPGDPFYLSPFIAQKWKPLSVLWCFILSFWKSPNPVTRGMSRSRSCYLLQMIKQPSKVNTEARTIPWQLPERSAVWRTAEKTEVRTQASLSCIPKKLVWERLSRLDWCFCNALGVRSLAFLVFCLVIRASGSTKRSQWHGGHAKGTHNSGRSTVHLRAQAGKKHGFLVNWKKKSKNLSLIFT